MAVTDLLPILDEHAGSIMAIATIILVMITAFYAYRTQEILRVQRKMVEWSAMPIFRFEDYYISRDRQKRETWVRLMIERNIAQGIKGEIFLEKEDFSSNRVVLDTFNPTTAMQGRETAVTAIRVDDRINALAVDDIFKVQAELTYESLLGGKYKSSHWLVFRKVDKNNNVKRTLSDMEYDATPFR